MTDQIVYRTDKTRHVEAVQAAKLPSDERLMKGDIEITGREDWKSYLPAIAQDHATYIDREKAATPTVRAKRDRKPYFEWQCDKGAITMRQRNACRKLNSCYWASISARIGRCATSQLDDGDGGEGIPPELVSYFNGLWKGLIGDPDPITHLPTKPVILTPYERGEMVRMVIHDARFDQVFEGRPGIRQMYAILMMDRMARYFGVAPY